MNNLNLLLAQNEAFKLVKVTFPGSIKQYTYKTTLDVEAGSHVVVNSPRQGLVVVPVVEVIPAVESNLTFSFDIKWLVSIVDEQHYEDCLEMERKVNRELNKLEAAKRREELMTDMKERLGEAGVKAVQSLVRL